LEAELGRRVESLAVAVSASISQESWRMLFSLGPGEESSRTARHLRALMNAVRGGTGSERISVWTIDGRVVLDAETPLLIGSPAPRAPLLGQELDEVRGGHAASTRLFRSESGRWVKIGLAPIPADEPGVAPRGVMVVEAPSQSLAVVAAMRRTLLGVGVIGLCAVLAAAFLSSRAATRRLRELVASAQRIGRGDLDSRVPAVGDDEIGVLGSALEGMRAAVKVRDHHLRAMVGGVAHEIRNPLGGLLLFAEMLSRDGDLSQEQARRAQRILDETTRLEQVVSEFLAYARPEVPRGENALVGPLLTESAESAAGALRWKGDLRVSGGDLRVWCDPGHLRQIALNLVRNAMQAAGAGVAAGGQERVVVRAVAGIGGSELIVEDSGPGIPTEERERVFEPFYSTRSAGSGLGLAIVKHLCDLNRIQISVGDSELGGARFRLRFRDLARG
jgi:signal transduction histidine kinase